MINEKLIRQTVNIFKPDNQLFEVRIFGKSKNDILSGYFKSADELLTALSMVNTKGKNCFFTLNSIDPALYSRSQKDVFLKGVSATSDKDVLSLDWLFIDVDPIRPADTSSTDEQLKHAKKIAGKIWEKLLNIGFSYPITAMSGNGFHLLYRIALKNNTDNVNLVKRCLAVLAMDFDDDVVSVDTSVFNPARICCLYGTTKQKGSDTEERPHRMTNILYVPRSFRTTDKSYLEKLAAEFPEEVEQAHKSDTSRSFDLESFMSDHGITFSKMVNARDSIAYLLDECPFDPSHRDGDAKIFHYSNGAIAFKCHHNSCSGYKWQDLRKKYDPDCYDRQNYFKPKKQINKEAAIDYSKPEVIEKYSPETFRTPLQIIDAKEPEVEFIKTGFSQIDDELNGLPKTELSLISGLRASGKSTLIAQLLLNVTEQGYTSICYSGELANKNYMDWIYRIAAGHNFVSSTGEYKHGYMVTPEIKQKIAEWIGDKLWLYNNRLGNKFSQISSWLRDAISDKRADLVILDNMMILDFAEYSKDRYESQKLFVTELLHIAQQTNCHICFVAHPRKSFGFLRLEDVSGASEIVNLVSQAFIVHKINEDFKRSASQFIPKAEYEELINGSATNLIDIAKDRDGGAQDIYVPLWYEPISKRLRNHVAEFHVYPWQKTDEWQNIEYTFEEIKDI